ncbi:hypothetical protein ACFL27_25200, partial [candidate division CSSED10-310 bacterium]
HLLFSLAQRTRFPILNEVNLNYRDILEGDCPIIGNCNLVDCLAKIPRITQKKITLNTDYYIIYYDSYDIYGNVAQMRETPFNSLDEKRKKIYQYAWQQSNDIDSELIIAHIVSPVTI